jgi:hypothetical protein
MEKISDAATRRNPQRIILGLRQYVRDVSVTIPNDGTGLTELSTPSLVHIKEDEECLSTSAAA